MLLEVEWHEIGLGGAQTMQDALHVKQRQAIFLSPIFLK